ncbi:MAG: UDP-N-acetylmuramate--alanine ligase [Porphyromonadaceae bacterium CG2_30_38_12]|nr:MAG: UDP-N-acetylmuramate--alanine ligase [Porphyromonadaceae bacterium CG2_30_38_12]
MTINNFNTIFFIGVAGTGMSAIAQYLRGTGKNVSGSDRYFKPDVENDIRTKLEAEGIRCFVQDGSGITNQTDLVVVSTAIEDTIIEVKKAKELNIPILRRSQVLALIADSKKTIAVGGTSGKSTTSAMLFDIMQEAGLEPSIISGAGLTSIIREGKIGNAKVGKGEWLVIEADESDGSIVQYHPEIGLLLNIDKDHQEIDELMKIFGTFRDNTKEIFITNRSNKLAAKISVNAANDFTVNEGSEAGYKATKFVQNGFEISFEVAGASFKMNTVGRHNMENALAAIAVVNQLGVSFQTAAAALAKYEGIYRRHQLIGEKNGVILIDDYAHNPAKCAASISACQPVATKVIAWFQPHGYGPTRFLRNDFVSEIAAVLRPQDEIWMSEIFYAGGTAVKDISANDLIEDLCQLGKNAYFVEDRNQFVDAVKSHFAEKVVLLLMGARDPSLENFAKEVYEKLE